MVFPLVPLTARDMTSCKGTLALRDIGLRAHRSPNTIQVYPVSPCAFASQRSLFFSSNTRKIRPAPLVKKKKKSEKKRKAVAQSCGMWPRRRKVRAFWVFVFGRRCWGWSETCYRTHEKPAARDAWQSSQNFGFTAVSVTHRAACLCAAIQLLCCCVRRKETMRAGLTVDQQNCAGGSWSLDSVAHWRIMVYVAGWEGGGLAFW